MFTILVATLIKKDNKYLLVKEQKANIRGLLNLPAGHLEINETLVDAAVREVREETGVDVKISQLIDTKYFTKNEKNYIAFVFKGEIISQNAKNELNFDFYDYNYLVNNKIKLRDADLIFSAIKKENSGCSRAIKILKGV